MCNFMITPAMVDVLQPRRFGQAERGPPTGNDTGFPRRWDLDIRPAVGGESSVVGRIWCDSGVPVELRPEVGGPNLTFTFARPRRKPTRRSWRNGQNKRTRLVYDASLFVGSGSDAV